MTRPAPTDELLELSGSRRSAGKWSAPAVRRHAPAGRDGPGPGPGRRRAAHGRAVRRARRDDPRPAARRAGADLRGADADGVVRDAQRPRGGPARRPGDRAEQPAGPGYRRVQGALGGHRIDTAPGTGWRAPSPNGCARRWGGMATDQALHGLDQLELQSEQESAAPSRFGRRVWAAAWPKLLAIALVLAIWELVALSGWKHYVLKGPAPVLEPVEPAAARRSSGRGRDDAGAGSARLRGGAGDRLVVGYWWCGSRRCGRRSAR